MSQLTLPVTQERRRGGRARFARHVHAVAHEVTTLQQLQRRVHMLKPRSVEEVMRIVDGMLRERAEVLDVPAADLGETWALKDADPVHAVLETARG